MKCLVIDKMHESIEELFGSIGIEIDYRPEIKAEEVYAAIPEFDGVVVRSKINVDARFLDHAKSLKFIARAGAGLDQIDVEEVEKRNIHLVNAPEGNRDALAEHALGSLLSMLNYIRKSDREIRNGVWDREGNRGHELSSKTVGLLGYGYMAQAFAKRLKAMGCRVLAYDKYKTGFSDEYAQEASMEKLYSESDVFSIHVPLTAETNRMVDLTYLEKFEKNLWLINTARGKVLNLESLVIALENGKVKGAALDVLENEKLTQLSDQQRNVFNQLINYEQVIFTPHIAGWSFESYYKINEVLKNKLASILFKD